MHGRPFRLENIDCLMGVSVVNLLEHITQIRKRSQLIHFSGLAVRSLPISNRQRIFEAQPFHLRLFHLSGHRRSHPSRHRENARHAPRKMVKQAIAAPEGQAR
jgi:hypothetical protein